MTLAQLTAVAKACDSSEVVEEGGKVVLKTTNPAFWIGKGGIIVKQLSQALGRRIEVRETKPQPRPKVVYPFIEGNMIVLAEGINPFGRIFFLKEDGAIVTGGNVHLGRPATEKEIEKLKSLGLLS